MILYVTLDGKQNSILDSVSADEAPETNGSVIIRKDFVGQFLLSLYFNDPLLSLIGKQDAKFLGRLEGT